MLLNIHTKTVLIKAYNLLVNGLPGVKFSLTESDSKFIRCFDSKANGIGCGAPLISSESLYYENKLNYFLVKLFIFIN